MAFWVNAYNAFVLQTVVDHYPIRGASPGYPAESIRQIPGAFEQLTPPRRRPERDARRDREDDPAGVQGAASLSRARTRRDRQRPAAQRGVHRRAPRRSSSTTSRRSSCRSRPCSGSIGRRRRCRVTPILSWHEEEFIAAYDKGDDGPLAQRSPIERAVARVHHAEPAAAREGVRAEEPVQGDISSVRLAAERPHGRTRRSSAWTFPLTDKVAIVTGSSRGLGLASARALVAEGCRVCICARGTGAPGRGGGRSRSRGAAPEHGR